MKYCFSILLILAMTACQKQDLQKIGKVETHELHSNIVNEDYKIEVFLPKGELPNQPVPIIYLLDGFWHFESFGNTFNKMVEQGDIPEAILVGINYGDGLDGEELRFRDLTYPKFEWDDAGGGLFFHQFLTTELVPFIESNYPSDTTQRTLLGHSLGGYFSLFSVVQFADTPSLTFKNFVAASPSLFYADSYVLKQEAAISENINDLPINLYMATGTLEGTAMNVLVDELNDRLLQRNYPSLNLKTEHPKEGHFPNAQILFQKGLKHVLN